MAIAGLSGRNPMSLHRPGRRARVCLDEARESLRRLCKAPKADVIFTSGGTEADHLAIQGIARHRRRATGCKRVLASEIEHPAVQEALNALRADGFEIQALPAPDGYLDIEQARSLIDEKVALVAVMLAHNTTGIIQPVAELASIATAAGVPIHSDAVQAAGKIELDFYGLGVTSLALSAHKFGGPRGVGALVLQKCVDMEPLWAGGGQEEGKRSGTHASALIAGMAAAADAVELHVSETEYLRDTFEQALVQQIQCKVLGAGFNRLPNTSSVVIDGIVGRDFVREMDAKGVAVSAGAACHSGQGGSGLAGQVRFSLGPDTTEQELMKASQVAVDIVLELRGLL